MPKAGKSLYLKGILRSSNSLKKSIGSLPIFVLLLPNDYLAGSSKFMIFGYTILVKVTQVMKY